MSKKFSRIALFARQYRANKEVNETLQALQDFLLTKKIDTYIEEETANHSTCDKLPSIESNKLGKRGDLIIAVGGDGNFLNAARTAIQAKVPVLGVNRGHLGFLTDILPEQIEVKVAEILNGQYTEEDRFLIEGDIKYNGKSYHHDAALNDIVLSAGDNLHMIEFEILINDKPVCSQRADGLIITTPTGSTAYALSGGGPILHPQLNAISIVPMFPHKLTSRPIVIGDNNRITIAVSKQNVSELHVRFDGQEKINVQPGTVIDITKKAEQLRLIHPLDYNYYETLRSKLGWESKLLATSATTINNQ